MGLPADDDKPTGLAVLDEDGRLIHVSSQPTFDDVLATLAPWTSGPCVVAVDAPLQSGEGGPAWPEAVRLVKRLGLDSNPASGRPRRAIDLSVRPEVVDPFRIDPTLTPKQRSRISGERLRGELERVVGVVEAHASAVPPLHVVGTPEWESLRDDLARATRKRDLRDIEDRLDAIISAYTAHVDAQPRPTRGRSAGVAAAGAAAAEAEESSETSESSGATETSDAQAAPRDGAVVHSAVQAYAARQPELAAVTAEYTALVTTLLDDAGINYLTVTGRTKSVASFAGKANRVVDGRPLYADPLTEITDQIGVRVVTYVHSDVAAVADLLADQLSVLNDRDMGVETAKEGRFGYSSRHVLVALDPGRGPAPEHPGLLEHRASVQIRTVLQHAWAEFEHDIRYKGTIPEEHVPDLDRRFTLAAGLLELADKEFSTIRDRLQATMTDQRPESDLADPRISSQDLATFLAGQYADAGWSRTDHYAWISGLLLELGVDSLDELGALLASVDSAAISARLDYRYPPGAVRRLDDALLAVFGEQYVGLHGNAHRVDALRARLERMSHA
ncbi:DUF429 domain-containing protein [Janibacter sp. G56]|uniref:DUF429 domain-containing protein n=1 Tax=Janibacter sp. G56 TaxID=3418717 RepID=UPI003CFC155E